ncbi:MAG: GNAT family N-acetyltransferase [Myxococcales bacterium]|nr:GNAT family N-acetyltransferase [Myxococcales bacterium]
MAEFLIREVTEQEFFERIWRFRVAARLAAELMPEDARHLGYWIDSHDEHAVQFAAFDRGGVLLAVARFCVHSRWEDLPHASLYEELRPAPPVASFNRLTVCPSARGYGIGRALDRVRLDRALALGVAAVVVPVTEDLVAIRAPSLSQLGFMRSDSLRLEPECGPGRWGYFAFTVSTWAGGDGSGSNVSSRCGA